MDDDLEIEFEGPWVDAARREGPDRGSLPVGQEELVAVPARYDELLCSGRWEQQPHARRRVRDGQTLEVRAAERDADHAGAQVLDATHRHAAKPRWFTPGAHRRRTLLRAAHCDRRPTFGSAREQRAGSW